MNTEAIDPDNLPLFQLPESFLKKMFDLTGSGSDENRGFVLSYVSHDGRPVVYARAETQIVDMGLRKALERYLMEMERSEDAQNLNSENED